MLLAADMGVDRYSSLGSYFGTLAGEWLFARVAHGISPDRDAARRLLDPYDASAHPARRAYEPLFRLPPSDDQSMDDVLAELKYFEACLPDWIDRVVRQILDPAKAYRVVGCTTSFDQTNASIALLKELRRRDPSIVTLIGGANCEGEMADGIASLDPQGTCLDYIFAGESEAAFPQFLQQLEQGCPPTERIVRGRPCRNLESLPTTDLSEFFDQIESFLPEAVPLDETMSVYESSRGCWWGEKHHCTFCGLNGQGMDFRLKSPERVLRDLQFMAQTYPAQAVAMSDNIMPHRYFRTLLPRLADLGLPLKIFYEQKANLSLDQACALKDAGIVHIQPGIEALSTSLLRRMDKGVSARQNIELMWLARSLGIRLEWNLLWAFPSDETRSYEETLALAPLLIHLQPPSGLAHLVVDRFSPYFDRPENYGVTNIRPHPGYQEVFPPEAIAEKIAYHFAADYECGAYDNLEVLEALRLAIDQWAQRWADGSAAAPRLRVRPAHPALGGYVLSDTRGLPGTKPTQWIDAARAAAALPSRLAIDSAEIAWALEQKVGTIVDGKYVPLATASADLLRRFCRRGRSTEKQVVPLESMLIGELTIVSNLV